MLEGEPRHLATRFKEKIKPLGKKVAFPLSSVVLAVAAACSNGGNEPTPTPTESPTFTPEPTATETFTPTSTEIPYTSGPLPKECNTAKFITPVDGQTVPVEFQVIVDFAHNYDWNSSCYYNSLEFNPAKFRLIDPNGHKYYYGFGYDCRFCIRDHVVIADCCGANWQIEALIEDQVVGSINVIRE